MIAYFDNDSLLRLSSSQPFPQKCSFWLQHELLYQIWRWLAVPAAGPLCSVWNTDFTMNNVVRYGKNWEKNSTLSSQNPAAWTCFYRVGKLIVPPCKRSWTVVIVTTTDEDTTYQLPGVGVMSDHVQGQFQVTSDKYKINKHFCHAGEKCRPASGTLCISPGYFQTCKRIQTRDIQLHNLCPLLQFNPASIRSTSRTTSWCSTPRNAEPVEIILDSSTFEWLSCSESRIVGGG